ncbi:MAG: hypothetical protein ACFFDT_32345 [Candidatus Hodarchaeota archaeon]
MELFLRVDPPKGRIMWLNIQTNFFFVKSLARFLEAFNAFGGEAQSFMYNTIKKEFQILYQEVLKQTTFTSRVAISNPESVFSALIEVTNQLGYGWFEVLKYDKFNKEITINVVDSIWAHIAGLSGQSACAFLTPVIAAAAEIAHQKICEAIQESCTSSYDPICSFRVKILDTPLGRDFGPIKRVPGGFPLQDISLLSRNLNLAEKGWYYFFGHPLVLIPAGLFPKLQHSFLSMDKDPQELVNKLYNIFYLDAVEVMQSICASPKIAHSLRESPGLQEIVVFLLEELHALGWGKPQQELMVFNEISREYHIVLANSVIAENYPFPANEIVCHAFTATFAALIGVMHGQEYMGKEMRCLVQGDATCEFHLGPT